MKKDEADERFTVFFGGPDFGPKFGPSPSWKFPNIFPISDSKFRNVIYQKKNLCTSCQNFQEKKHCALIYILINDRNHISLRIINRNKFSQFSYFVAIFPIWKVPSPKLWGKNTVKMLHYIDETSVTSVSTNWSNISEIFWQLSKTFMTGKWKSSNINRGENVDDNIFLPLCPLSTWFEYRAWRGNYLKTTNQHKMRKIIF